MPARTVQTQFIVTYRIEEDDLEHYGVRGKDFNQLTIQKVATVDGGLTVEDIIQMAETVDINPTSWKFVETNRYDDDGVVRIEENAVAVGKDSEVQPAGDLIADEKARKAAQQPSAEDHTQQQKQAAQESQRSETTTVATDESQKATLHADSENKGLADKGKDTTGTSEDSANAKADKDSRQSSSKESS